MPAITPNQDVVRRTFRLNSDDHKILDAHLQKFVQNKAPVRAEIVRTALGQIVEARKLDDLQAAEAKLVCRLHSGLVYLTEHLFR